MSTGESGGVSEVSERRLVRDVKKDRWRFHMSMKLEKMDVSSARPRRGWGVSREDMRGMRKFCVDITVS
jgi:hypothetical protein